MAAEQSDTLRLLRLNDRKRRHRRIKKQHRYERLAATSQLSVRRGQGGKVALSCWGQAALVFILKRPQVWLAMAYMRHTIQT